MPQNYWTDNDPDQDLDPLSSLLSEFTNPEDEEDEFRSDFFQGLEGRRRKAAFVLMGVWGITIGLHLVTWGHWAVLAITGLLSIQVLQLIFAQPEATPTPLSDESLAGAATVALLAAAKNEQAVIGNLVTQLCNLDYSIDKYEVWVVDDASTDKTPEILDNLAKQYPQLRVIHRLPNAGGGKSGALNAVLPHTKADIIGVFDADAQVSPDLLRAVVPLFDTSEMGAVQVRKAIANEGVNFWTKGQSKEMALDAYLQQQRISVGGVGELRGNGQFVRRLALQRCGGWNEQTITDDLDLTIRLHLDNWKIGFLPDPVVEEEGVTTALALWHQRNRWAEGGYQRYLDYWRFILHPRFSLKKKLDLIFFLGLQYLIPTAAIPDFVMVLTRHQFPVFVPLTMLTLAFSVWGIYNGLKRTYKGDKLGFTDSLAMVWQGISGTVYMIHWFIILPFVTTRMSIRAKRLKWVKTVHQGETSESFEF